MWSMATYIISAKNLVAYHSESLICFVNNNCVENYNSIVEKYTGGKRVNFSFRGKKKNYNFKQIYFYNYLCKIRCF